MFRNNILVISFILNSAINKLFFLKRKYIYIQIHNLYIITTEEILFQLSYYINLDKYQYKFIDISAK